MRPRDMTVRRGGKGSYRVVFENTTEIVVIDASAAKLNQWAREIVAVTGRALAEAGIAASARRKA